MFKVYKNGKALQHPTVFRNYEDAHRTAKKLKDFNAVYMRRANPDTLRAVGEKIEV